jgi:hypothetical protein
VIAAANLLGALGELAFQRLDPLLERGDQAGVVLNT